MYDARLADAHADAIRAFLSVYDVRQADAQADAMRNRLSAYDVLQADAHVDAMRARVGVYDTSDADAHAAQMLAAVTSAVYDARQADAQVAQLRSALGRTLLTKQHGHVLFQVVTGPIQINAFGSDAIVNSTNPQLAHGEGLEKYIIQEALRNQRRRNRRAKEPHQFLERKIEGRRRFPPLPGRTLQIPAGVSLSIPVRDHEIARCKVVEHVVVPKLSAEGDEPDDNERKAFRYAIAAALSNAEAAGCTSITIPPVGAGLYYWPSATVAKIIIDAAIQSQIPVVRLIDLDVSDNTAAFIAYLRALAAAPAAPAVAPAVVGVAPAVLGPSPYDAVVAVLIARGVLERRMCFPWVQTAVDMQAVAHTPTLVAAFPGLSPPPGGQAPAPSAAEHALKLNTPARALAAATAGERWDVSVHDFVALPAAEVTATKLYMRVWTKEEFKAWLIVAQADYESQRVRTDVYNRRDKIHKRAVGVPMQLHRFRTAATPWTTFRASDPKVPHPVTRYLDALQAYRWGVRCDEDWSPELLEMWACSMDCGDPRLLIYSWDICQRLQDTEISPVFGLLQGLVNHAPATTALAFHAFEMRLFKTPTTHTLTRSTDPVYADDELETLYFEPSITAQEDLNTKVMPPELTGPVDAKRDPDLVFQRALVMVARGVSRNEHMNGPHPAVDGVHVHRTFALCRTTAAVATMFSTLNARRAAIPNSAAYDFFHDTTWDSADKLTDVQRVDSEQKQEWQGTLFVLYGAQNTWVDILTMFYGAAIPEGLRLEEDYEDWEFPRQQMKTHLRATHTNVFRSMVHSQYVRTAVDGNAVVTKTTAWVKLAHLERMMPLLVLPYV